MDNDKLEHLYSVSKVAEFRLLEAEYLGLARKGTKTIWSERWSLVAVDAWTKEKFPR